MTLPLLAQNVKKLRILYLRQCENANEIYWAKNKCRTVKGIFQKLKTLGKNK